MDNASNSGTMMCTIAAAHDVLPDFDAEGSLVCCFAHILHLTVCAGLTKLCLPDVDDKDITGGNSAPVEKPMAQALSMVEGAGYPTLVMIVLLLNIVMDKLEDVDLDSEYFRSIMGR
ncbi:hypothetical protein M427DRAFT_33973 [Gonapodya prolifera JEL478]|uniref:Uncharacterized protein n=1 Tax=Gonapodya prolifera (strain JEL478) TaxID=1344416 RepID=A0A139A9D6_GONPJ|nr:hypothetical protein M427DRAFT_33973 [Gonapodya prolifera JEL478]|eukprot:KXS13376.1 hypothetical protein M427DRAFT_33973 [Gonapodya prolifera JEL478]